MDNMPPIPPPLCNVEWKMKQTERINTKKVETQNPAFVGGTTL